MREGRPLGNTFKHVGFRAGVALIGILAFFPLADWIPGGPGTNLPQPLWPYFVLWVVGSLGIGILAWVGLKLLPAKAASSSPEPRPRKDLLTGKWVAVFLLVALPAAFYSITAMEVFDARPLHIDGMTQAFQAQLFSGGRLSVPAPDDSPFFSTFMIVEHEGRAFSHFPPGWSALLTLGLLLGVPWIMAPLCGAMGAYGLYLLLRENGEAPRVALWTGLLFAFTPWVAFNAASWMNHVPAVCFIILGSAALLRGIRRPSAWIWLGLSAASLGIATLCRPLDGVAFGLPATVWVVARAWRDPSLRRGLLAFAVGGFLTTGLLMAYNWAQTGSPTTFAFDLQWGSGHGLGFHEAPWGPPHTLARGVQLINGYLLGLQMMWFEAPFPSLLPALVALFLVRRLDGMDRYLLTGSLLILLGYFSFWGEGNYLGPRYLLPLAPVLAIWTVRFGSVLFERTRRPGVLRWANTTVALVVAGGWLLGAPARWSEYRSSNLLRRVSVQALATPMADKALVFLPSPWSSQILARLRGTGLSRRDAQWFHDRIGLCRLDVALADLDRRQILEPERVAAELLPLTADSASMIRDPLTGAPGDPFSGVERAGEAAATLCQSRVYLEETRGGYLLLPFLARLGPTWLDGGPILARDLYEENPRLLEANPDRVAYYLRPVRGWGRVQEFVLEPLHADSARAVWAVLDSLRLEAAVF